jgi:uncharacterized lipoprotein NlpE involved in copper resistance
MFIVVLFVTIFSGCNSKNTPDISNSQISVDWTGDYFGLLPEEVYGKAVINAQITLNPDLTFYLRYRYLGITDVIFTDMGTFSWNETGDIIQINFSCMTFPPYYKVGEKRLIMLEMDGKTIYGKLGDNYILRK